ncbi:ergosterol 28 [Aaosphaeria arxii CBS 175.79]|uniref:Ergosterol 28 n=1 Tax=Aaosphaeria arxii CBS 175.79 TaxID=1450172 RepID=A0A6A5Y1I9_9PLEO|nr:ergosterol 28 [Aaosphaeria arxii CBS 175.79]KAF2019425.1 ergosterol 28 [Aaosphaeria arxii CBS 175.79]
MASHITSYLPPGDGLLPKWLLMVSVIAVTNSLQAYISLRPTQRVYAGGRRGPSPVTPLSARTFGTWTFLSAVVRLYAAYNVTDRRIYELAFWTYGVAFAHFVSEWLVFGTCRFDAGLAGPGLVSSVSLVWMWRQWGWYVGSS